MKYDFLPEVNEVQLRILTKLTTSPNGLRYSEMRPFDEYLENDLYNYHLQYLVKNELVSKEGNLYQTTEKGKVLTTNMDALGKVQQLFKVSVALQVVREVNGKREILRHKRLRHPFYGDVTSVSGKVHHGELIEDAAKRKLKEETGLEAEFKLLGVLRKIRKNKQGKLIEDTLYHVCYAENPIGKLIKKNVYGENFWSNFDQAIQFIKLNTDVGEYDIKILEHIHDNNLERLYWQQTTVVNTY